MHVLFPSATATPRQVAESYWQAECERNVDDVLEHFHADATFTAPQWRLMGRAEIRKYYHASYSSFPGLAVQIMSAVETGNVGAFEWLATLTDHSGLVRQLRGVNLVNVEAGKFRSVTCYFDPTNLSGP